MPRVAIEKLKLIKTEDLQDLVGRNLEAIRCALLETSYRDAILRFAEEADTILMEEALLENFAETMQNLEKSSVGEIKTVLLAIIGKFETSNIKTLLRAAKAKMNPDEAVRHIIPIGTLDKDRCRDILSASSTIGDIVEALSSSYGSIMGEALFESMATDDLLPLELALEKAVYQKIFDTVDKLKGLDKSIARNVLGIEVDMLNLKTVLRLRTRGVPKDELREHLVSTFLFDVQTLEKALVAKDMASLTKYLWDVAATAKNSFYKDLLAKISKYCNLPLSQLEIILERAPLRMSLEMQQKYLKYYNVSYILAFLNLKWLEIRNLRCIIVGSERKIADEQVRRLLIL